MRVDTECESRTHSKEVRMDLHIRATNRGLSAKEIKFLQDIALKGNDEEIKLATEKLADTDLFFDTTVIQRNVQSVERIRGIEARRDSIKARRDSIKARRDSENSFIQKDLWKIHEEGVERHSRRELMMRRATLGSARDLIGSMKKLDPLDCKGEDDSSDNKKGSRSSSFVNFSKEISVLENCRVIEKKVHEQSLALKIRRQSVKGRNVRRESLVLHEVRRQSALRRKSSMKFGQMKSELSNKIFKKSPKNNPDKRKSISFGKEDTTFNLPAIYFTKSEEDENENLDAICEQLVYGGRPSSLDSAQVEDSSSNLSLPKSGEDEILIETESRDDTLHEEWPTTSNMQINPVSLGESSDDIGFEVYDNQLDLNCIYEEEDDVSETIVDERVGAWNNMDEDAFEYEAGCIFHIFGTNANDESTQPHVLSPPLMDSLRNFLPYSIAEQNFWLKHSLVRDGAELMSLLRNVRGAKATIIAIETMAGEVFGTFTSMPWRKQHGYFGNGEAFLWRLRRNRLEQCDSLEKLAMMESKLDVYSWSGENYMIQLCHHDQLAVGGGEVGNCGANFGLAFDSDLHLGTTGDCSTFNNPPLAQTDKDGIFEVLNLEAWTFSPCETLEAAEKLEFGNLFFEDALKQANKKDTRFG